MNRHHPYGGYDAGPPERANRPMAPTNEGGYGSEGAAGGYYPSPTPPQHHLQNQPPPQHYPSSSSLDGQNEYQGGPTRGSYQPPPQDYRAGAPSNMPPPGMAGGRDGRMTGPPALTLGSGPLNNQNQYGGPIRYDGANGGQSPAPMMNNHNAYGSSSASQHYTSESAANPSRNYPPPMRAQGYESHLPPKPDSSYSPAPPRPSLSSPPSHLPRAPGRDWGEEQGPKRARRDGGKADEEKTSDEIIKERLRRERPCRTLFVRNVEFNADIEDLRRRFEAFGEIKSWFDLTSKRGLLFISYFDMRCAEHAKASMQEFEVNGRRVDVHYSLPRESDMTKRCDRDKDQGTLFILLKRAQGELNDAEVRATFSQYGEIKSLRRYKDQGNCRFLEYYDCRHCKAAHDAMIGTTWNGGVWDMKYAWDAATPDRIADKPKSTWDHQQQGGQGGQGYGAPAYAREAALPSQQQQQQGSWNGGQQYGAPPPAASTPVYPSYGQPGGDYRPPPPAGGPAPGASYGTKRPYDYDDRAAQEAPMRRWGQPQGPAQQATSYGPPRPDLGPGGGGGYGPPAAGAERSPYGPPPPGRGDYGRYGGEQNEYGPPNPANGPPANRWGAAGGGAGGYGAAPPPPAGPHQGLPPPLGHSMQRPPPPPLQQQQQGPPLGVPATSNDDRLEQAQKVQQLLASLKPGNLSGGGAAAKPTAASPPAPAPATAAAAPAPSLPSNIAALLQMAQNNAAKK